MAKILLLYSTRDGHTREIAFRIQQTLTQEGHEVTLAPITDGPVLDLQAFDKIVVGASIRYGKHHRQVYDFVERYGQVLDSKPNAFFSVNVVARKPGKDRPDTNPYLRKFLKQIAWRPRELAVFAGKLDYPRYGVLDRTAIRLIMWMTKGPTDPETVVEFTNWDRVESFAQRVSVM